MKKITARIRSGIIAFAVALSVASAFSSCATSEGLTNLLSSVGDVASAAGYGTAGDYRVSWLNTTSKRLDTKLFRAENPEMYDRYAKESSCRRFMVKRIAA